MTQKFSPSIGKTHDPSDERKRSVGLWGIILGGAVATWGIAPTLSASLLPNSESTAAVETTVATPSQPASPAADAPAPQDPPFAPSAQAATVPSADASPSPKVEIAQTEYKLVIQPGDNLSKLFARFDIPPGDLAKLLRVPDAKRHLNRIRGGDTLVLTVDSTDSLRALEYKPRKGTPLAFRHEASGFASSHTAAPHPVEGARSGELSVARGTIDSSFYNAARSAGLSSATALALARMFKPLVNLSRVQPGDTFSVLFKEKADSMGIIKEQIVAAELFNRKKQHQIVRYTTAKGRTGTYSPDGDSLINGFLRYPVSHKRVSSGFSKRRWHPKLHRTRAHLGVDFSAPMNTPVKASGTGKVVFIGEKRGYGKTIEIQHGHRYRTVYAHLSRFESRLRKNSAIQQGQVIGYVGKSGLATGPHLHYELHRDGRPIDPMKSTLPNGPTLAGTELQQFRRYAAQALARLETQRKPVKVAALDATDAAGQL